MWELLRCNIGLKLVGWYFRLGGGGVVLFFFSDAELALFIPDFKEFGQVMGKEYPRQSCHILMSDSWNLSPVTEVWKNQDGAEQLSSSCNPLHEHELFIIAHLGASLTYRINFFGLCQSSAEWKYIYIILQAFSILLRNIAHLSLGISFRYKWHEILLFCTLYSNFQLYIVT